MGFARQWLQKARHALSDAIRFLDGSATHLLEDQRGVEHDDHLASVEQTEITPDLEPGRAMPLGTTERDLKVAPRPEPWSMPALPESSRPSTSTTEAHEGQAAEVEQDDAPPTKVPIALNPVSVENPPSPPIKPPPQVVPPVANSPAVSRGSVIARVRNRTPQLPRSGLSVIDFRLSEIARQADELVARRVLAEINAITGDRKVDRMDSGVNPDYAIAVLEVIATIDVSNPEGRKRAAGLAAEFGV